MPYNSETSQYERRATTVIDATPDGDTVAVAIDVKLDQGIDDYVTDLNHHAANGKHYPPESVASVSRFLKQSPAGIVSWADGAAAVTPDWNAASGADGFIANKPTLGTASSVDRQASTYDTTAGALALVGAFGLGAANGSSFSASDAFNNISVTGFYQSQATYALAVGAPLAAAGVLYHQNYGATNAAQVWFAVGSSPKVYTRSKASGVWSAWRLVYHQGAILGAVSQSSGTPTGAIIERGSNSNGEYVRFADGTQICTLRTSVTDQAIDSAVGAIYTGTRSWTFPSAFIAPPVISFISRWGTGAGWGSSGYPSTTGVSLRFLDTASRATGTEVVILATAIGRWF